MNILAERLWYNRTIRIGGKTLFINGLHQSGIIMINDLVRNDGSIMSLRELKNVFPTAKVDFITYQSLIRGIPQMWKDKLANKRCNKLSIKNNHVTFMLGKNRYKITEMKSIHFYSAQLEEAQPCAINRWEQDGYQVDDWTNVFRIPYV